VRLDRIAAGQGEAVLPGGGQRYLGDLAVMFFRSSRLGGCGESVDRGKINELVLPYLPDRGRQPDV